MIFGSDIGIDLGTTSVMIYVDGQGIVLYEPAVVAVNRTSGEVIAIGEEASRMIGRTPENIRAIRPLSEGVISDFEMTEKMLKYFINKAIGKQFSMKLRPRICVCVPSGATEVECRAVEDATRQVGAREVYLIEEPIAAAIGAGIDISRACGSMVVDIGGGTTDAAVISLGGVVTTASIKVGSNNLDDAVIRYMRKRHNMLIGERSAEELKINIGTVFDRMMPVVMEIKGRNLVTGLPNIASVSSDEMRYALHEPIMSIVETVCSVLEKTPPELVADVSERGIVLTGGGSLVYGLDKLISYKTGISCVIADNAIACVAVGTGKYIEYISRYKNVGIKVRKRK